MLEKTMVTKVNAIACVVWASLYLSGQAKFVFTHPDGKVEVNF